MIAELQRFRAAERFVVKKLRTWLDRADEFVHSWEVSVREDSNRPLTATKSIVGKVSQAQDAAPVTALRRDCEHQECDVDGTLAPAGSIPFPRSSRFPRQKKRRRMTAAEFDLDIRERSAARSFAR